MKIFATALAALSIWVAAFATPATAGGRDSVMAFYAFLSNPTSQEHADAAAAALSDDWVSIGDYSGYEKTRDEFIGQISGFGQLIPDMNWEMEEVIRTGDRVIVRGRATGTPVGPMFGVDGEGRSFEIMSIDIHTLENGVITQSYHVEDWSGALRQLSGS